MRSIQKRSLATAVSALALCGMVGGLALTDSFSVLGGPAFAQENAGQGNQGGQGQGNKGSQSGQDNRGGSGAGQGGPDPDSDSKGPQAGGPAATGSSGGKPAWAQEGIPEDVELGRLSVARAPDQVLDRAFDEALANLSPEMIDFYSDKTLNEIYEALRTEWDTITLINSPLQNLALLEEAMDGNSSLYDKGVDGTSLDTLMAVFLGVASDKTVPITTETVVALTVIFDKDWSDQDMIDLAVAAEMIRTAVLEGHG